MDNNLLAKIKKVEHILAGFNLPVPYEIWTIGDNIKVTIGKTDSNKSYAFIGPHIDSEKYFNILSNAKDKLHIEGKK